MWIAGQVVDEAGREFATLKRQIDRLSTYVATISARLQTGVVVHSSD